MKVLILHSRYRSGPASGENRVVEDEAKLLTEAGHQVHVWDPVPENVHGAGLLGTGLRTIWSQRAARHVQELIRAFAPDVVHAHNLFPELSPASIRAVGGQGAPLVMTLHNYRLMCLPATLLRDERRCELCVGRIPWRGVAYGCYRNSTLGSGALAASLTLHRTIGTFDRVDLYLAVSDFVRAKHIEAGMRPDAIRVKPHFAWEAPPRSGTGDYFLYLGRLSAEKGISGLVDLWPGIAAPLVVVGDGPEVGHLRAHAPSNVAFRGTVSPAEVPALVSRARALLVPSIGFETAGKVVLEAYAAGVPVLASRVGALPEVVEDDVTGYLLPPGDRRAWKARIDDLLDDATRKRLGDGARRAWSARYSPRHGLDHLESAYEHAVRLFRGPRRRRG